jgi:hypothetical protein
VEEEDEALGGDQIPGEDEWDGTADYLANMGEHAREEGTVDRLPFMMEGVDEEEVMRLTLKAW